MESGGGHRRGAGPAGGHGVFTRIRVSIDALVAGNYTATQPHDVEVFQDVHEGKRAVTFSQGAWALPAAASPAPCVAASAPSPHSPQIPCLETLRPSISAFV